MSLLACIARAQNSGRLDDSRAKALAKRLAELEAINARTMGPELAARQAEVDLWKALSAEQARTKDLLARNVLTQHRILGTMDAHPDGPVAGLLSMLSRDVGDRHGTQNVDKLREHLIGLGHAEMAKAARRFRPTLTGGVRDTMGQANLVRALFGEAPADDPLAKEAGAAFTEMAEYYRQRAIAAGIDIAKLEDWRLPNPAWDARRIQDMGFEAFVRDLVPLLDEQKTYDRMAARKQELAESATDLSREIARSEAELSALQGERSAKLARRRSAVDTRRRAEVSLAAAERELETLEREGRDQQARYGENRPTRPYEQGRKRRTSQEVKRDKKRAPHAREAAVAIERLRVKRQAARDKIAAARTRLEEARAREVELTQRLDQIDTHRADWTARRDGLRQRLDMTWQAGADLPAAKVTPEDREEFLRAVYDTLRTDGLNKMEPTLQAGGLGKSLARKHDDAHRVIHFKDAESWLKAQQTFGRGSPWEVMQSHMERMAHDIAWAEIWGPNPEAIRKWAKDHVRQAAGMEDGPGVHAKIQARKKGLNHFDNVWDGLSGTANTPVHEGFARASSNFRSVLISAQLGSAFLSSISDIGTQALTARYNGLQATKVLARTVKLMASSKDQVAAVQMGLVAEGWTRMAAGAARYQGEYLAEGWGARLAHGVMESSLLGPKTRASQWAFGMEFLGSLGRLTGQTWEALPLRLRRAMETYGLDADAWEVARSAKAFEHDGARFLSVKDIARADHPRAAEIAATIHRMVLTERDYAVVTTDARTRAWLHQGLKPGTVSGELARFFGMYKSFGVTVMTTHLMRGLKQANLASKVGYLTAFAASTTVLGMAALQAKQLVRGKDPRPMDDPAAWGAAFMQGGGLGILGDFLNSEESRFGGGLAETLAGPAAGFAGDTLRLTVENAREIAQGKEAHLWADLVKFAGRYTPGSSLWYTRLALERLLLDQLALMDPDTAKGFRRLERRAQKDYGQGHYWRRGRMLPDRAPDWLNATGE